MKAKTIYRLKVTLYRGPRNLGENKPCAQIHIDSSNSLSTLAQVILKAFKFNYDHPFGFYSSLDNPFNAKEKYELFTEIDDIEPTYDALGVTHVRLSKVFPQAGKEMLFLFDYGDYWQFIVGLEGKVSAPGKSHHPVILEVNGQIPEQYPELNEEEWELDDDCSLCQELKKSGNKLQWYPDEPELQRGKRPH